MNYYKNQLDRINLESEYKANVKINDANGNSTNFMDLNDESATQLVKWLKENFVVKDINEEHLKIRIIELVNHIQDNEDYIKY